MSDSWYGWLRRDRRHKWRRVCGPCATMAECSRQLAELAKGQGIPDKHCCMTTGVCPRDVLAAGIDAKPTAVPGERSGDNPARPSGQYLGGL